MIRPAGERFYQGSLRLSLIGDSYTVQAWAVLIPVVRREDWERTRVHEAIRVTWAPRVPGSAVLTLFNVSDRELKATVEAFDADTGTRLLRWIEPIAPGRLVTVAPGSRLAATLGNIAGRDVRLRVAANGPGLLVTGKSRQADGAIDDVTLLHPQDAHASGSYPMLPLESHEVFLTLLNLGDEPSEVVAQFYWEGGTYAYGPVRVDARGSYRLAVDDVILHGQRDMLGQTLNPSHRHGFLKWSARAGSKALIGRTEARPRGGRDTFGFNCNACCGEVPSGVVVPSSVEFFVGQIPSFQTAVEIDTCNGTMGPYPTSATSFSTPEPFSWDGETIGASSSAEEEASFFGSEEGTLPGTVCDYRLMPITGLGSPSSCKTLLRKAHKPTESWSNSEACTLQDGNCTRCKQCCGAQKAYRLCKKQHPDVVESEYQVCFYECEIDHCV